jgi:hypothetical protein
MATAQVQTRYYQHLLKIPQWTRQRITNVTHLSLEHDRVVGFSQSESTVKYSLENPDLRSKLERVLVSHDPNFDHLRIKQFAMNSLTVHQLQGYLNTLEATGFQADLLIIDYAQLLKIDTENYRIALGQTVKDLEALAQDRNLALATVAQANREGAKAKSVDAIHVGEDWSAICTADQILTLTRTEVEKRHKLARLWVHKNRGDRDGFGVLLTQNLDHGQFVVESAALPGHYQDLLDRLN